MVLSSSLLAHNDELQLIGQGGHRMLAPEQSDAVALVQQALLALGYDLPDSGVDDNFGSETGAAVTEYKVSRGMQPSDPVVGVGTISQLDLEVSYLEGTVTQTHLDRPGVLALDVTQAAFVDLSLPDLDITRKLTDFFELGDRICFRTSFVLNPQAAALMGRIAEERIFKHYRDDTGLHAPGSDFFDTPSSADYVNFLLAQHSGLDPNKLRALGGRRRPDLLRNRAAGAEWYEIKPLSIAGAIAAWRKFNSIPADYADAGLPYIPGTAFTPAEFLPLASFVTDAGEQLSAVLHCRRPTPGLIFWELCIRGDYVRYFNRVRLAAGLLAILVLLAELLIPALEAGEIVLAVKALAVELGILLPALNAL